SHDTAALAAGGAGGRGVFACAGRARAVVAETTRAGATMAPTQRRTDVRIMVPSSLQSGKEAARAGSEPAVSSTAMVFGTRRRGCSGWHGRAVLHGCGSAPESHRLPPRRACTVLPPVGRSPHRLLLR